MKNKRFKNLKYFLGIPRRLRGGLPIAYVGGSKIRSRFNLLIALYIKKTESIVLASLRFFKNLKSPTKREVFEFVTDGIRKIIKASAFLKINTLKLLLLLLEHIDGFKYKRLLFLSAAKRTLALFSILALIFSPLDLLEREYLSGYLAGQLSGILPKTDSASASTLNDVYIFITTASTSFTVPLDWNNASNSVEVIGGGGGGGDAPGTAKAGGGGGGGYAKRANLSLTPGTSITFGVGAGGGDPGSNNAKGPNGGHTWFNAANFATCIAGGGLATCVGAEGGEGGKGPADTIVAALGGGTGSASGTTTYAGGGGGSGSGTTDGSTGGGGAAGPTTGANGTGKQAGSVTSHGGSGGGGAGGGSSG